MWNVSKSTRVLEDLYLRTLSLLRAPLGPKLPGYERFYCTYTRIYSTQTCVHKCVSPAPAPDKGISIRSSRVHHMFVFCNVFCCLHSKHATHMYPHITHTCAPTHLPTHTCPHTYVHVPPHTCPHTRAHIQICTYVLAYCTYSMTSQSVRRVFVCVNCKEVNVVHQCLECHVKRAPLHLCSRAPLHLCSRAPLLLCSRAPHQ